MFRPVPVFVALGSKGIVNEDLPSPFFLRMSLDDSPTSSVGASNEAVEAG